MAKNGTGALYLADLGYPMLPQGATEQEKFDELQDYLFRLTEALRWTLEHLDETNFNQNFFLQFSVGELYKPLPVEFEVSVYRITNYEVDAGVIGTLDGELTTTLTMTDISTQWYRHVLTEVTTATADGGMADTPTMADVTVEKGGS